MYTFEICCLQVCKDQVVNQREGFGMDTRDDIRMYLKVTMISRVIRFEDKKTLQQKKKDQIINLPLEANCKIIE